MVNNLNKNSLANAKCLSLQTLKDFEWSQASLSQN